MGRTPRLLAHECVSARARARVDRSRVRRRARVGYGNTTMNTHSLARAALTLGVASENTLCASAIQTRDRCESYV